MNKKTLPAGLHRDTLAVRAALAPSQYGENSEALFLTSGFVQTDAETAAHRFANPTEGFTYGRTSNPTVTSFEQRLAAMERPDRNDQRSAGFELFDQGRRNLRRRGGHQNGIVGCVFRPAESAVRRAHRHIVETQRAQTRARLLGKRIDDFNAVDLFDQTCQYRGLITRTGADLQHHILAPGMNQLGHQCDDVGLRDCLPMADRQRPIGIGAALQRRRHKSVSRHPPHGLQHTWMQGRTAGQMTGRRHIGANFIQQRLLFPIE